MISSLGCCRLLFKTESSYFLYKTKVEKESEINWCDQSDAVGTLLSETAIFVVAFVFVNGVEFVRLNSVSHHPRNVLLIRAPARFHRSGTQSRVAIEPPTKPRSADPSTPRVFCPSFCLYSEPEFWLFYLDFNVFMYWCCLAGFVSRWEVPAIAVLVRPRFSTMQRRESFTNSIFFWRYNGHSHAHSKTFFCMSTVARCYTLATIRVYCPICLSAWDTKKTTESWRPPSDLILLFTWLDSVGRPHVCSSINTWWRTR